MFTVKAMFFLMFSLLLILCACVFLILLLNDGMSPRLNVRQGVCLVGCSMLMLRHGHMLACVTSCPQFGNKLQKARAHVYDRFSSPSIGARLARLFALLA